MNEIMTRRLYRNSFSTNNSKMKEFMEYQMKYKKVESILECVSDRVFHRKYNNVGKFWQSRLFLGFILLL